MTIRWGENHWHGPLRKSLCTDGTPAKRSKEQFFGEAPSQEERNAKAQEREDKTQASAAWEGKRERLADAADDFMRLKGTRRVPKWR